MRNPFRKKTPEEEVKRLQAQRELEEKLKEVAQLGRDCLSDERFKRYKEAYIKARELLIKKLLENTEPDPIKYAFFAKSYLSKLDGMGMLIEAVEKDAKKEMK